MPVPGNLYGSRIGVESFAGNLAGISTYQMSAVNRGFSARFRALNTLDLKLVRLHWYGISVPGTITIRVETDSAGKPSGTLYDALATNVGFTPVAGAQTVLLGTPTTGLTVGNYYHVVLLTVTAGTSHNLSAYWSGSRPSPYPLNALTTATASTRSSFAETANSLPILSMVMEDDSEQPCGFLPYYQVGSTINIFGTSAVACKMVLNSPLDVYAVDLLNLIKTGTPAGDLRIRIYDSGDNLVPNASITENLTIISGASVGGLISPFAVIVSLPAGTYRVMFDSPNSVNSSNCWGIRTSQGFNPAAVGNNFWLSTCTTSGGNPGAWTDSSTEQLPVGLRVNALVAGGGGVGPQIMRPNGAGFLYL